MIGFFPQLNIVTWSSLVQSLMMHLHTDTFQRTDSIRVRGQEYDFFAWFHTAALVHLVGLERVGILQLLTVSCTFAQNIRLALHRCGRRLLGRHILERRIPSPWCSGNHLYASGESVSC